MAVNTKVHATVRTSSAGLLLLTASIIWVCAQRRGSLLWRISLSASSKLWWNCAMLLFAVIRRKGLTAKVSVAKISLRLVCCGSDFFLSHDTDCNRLWWGGIISACWRYAFQRNMQTSTFWHLLTSLTFAFQRFALKSKSLLLISNQNLVTEDGAFLYHFLKFW